MPDVPTMQLASGVDIPALGFGTWPLDDREAERMVAAALDVGYRLFDTAEEYGNERGVGRAVDRAGSSPPSCSSRRSSTDAGTGSRRSSRPGPTAPSASASTRSTFC